MGDVVSVKMILPEGQVAALLDDLDRAAGQLAEPPQPYRLPPNQLDLFGDQQFEPLMVLTIAVSLSFLADRVSRIVMRHQGRPGLVVDATGDTATFFETTALDPGEVLIIRHDETESLREEGLERAVSAVAAVFQSR
jgi:hypothetical protein